MNNQWLDLEHNEINSITESIAESFINRNVLTLVVSEPFQNREVVGTVVLIDQYLKRIRIELPNSEYEWVKVADILKISYLKAV